MVDARLPSEWLGSIRIDNLSDRAFRVLAGALMWCNGQGTDGVIPARYSRYLHPDGEDAEAFGELVRAGLWDHVDDGFRLVGWSTTLRQSTAEEVRRYREGAKRRQKEYRDRQRHGRAVEEPDDVTRNVTAHVGSGSSHTRPKKSAYASRDVTDVVTHNADSPFCDKHPAGTSDPCGACARVRTALEARESRLTIRGWDCTVDGHKFVADGTCTVCPYRPDRSVAS